MNGYTGYAGPRKSSQFTDKDWHDIYLARERLRAFKMRIQPYPLESGEPFELAWQGYLPERGPTTERLDKFQRELIRLSDTLNKHIKPKQKKQSGSFD